MPTGGSAAAVAAVAAVAAAAAAAWTASAVRKADEPVWSARALGSPRLRPRADCSATASGEALGTKPGSAQRSWSSPSKSSTPTIPKTRKMKPHRSSTLIILGITSKTHCTSSGMPGISLSARSGRSSRKARTVE